MKTFARSLSGLLLGLICAGAAARAAAPAPRLARLTRGVNLSMWFAQMPHDRIGHAFFNSYCAPADFALVARMGFRHVRLPVDPALFINEADPTKLNPEYLGDLDQAVDGILAAGLAVIIDPHPEEEFKQRLADPAFVAMLTTAWETWARHFANRDPGRVFLEVMNEPTGPVAPGKADWPAIQEKLLAALRRGAPKLTLIADAPGWSSVDDLVKLAPVADPDVVYNFHFYEPFPFTHQGANWAGPQVPDIRGLEYPMNPVNRAAVLAKLTTPAAREAVEHYDADKAELAAAFDLAEAWARRHHVAVTCNEFGVYRLNAPPASRLRWLRDVHELADASHIGWCMWDYAGGFSVVNTTADGGRTPDEGCVTALGLPGK